jgi:hypothetical protein
MKVFRASLLLFMVFSLNVFGLSSKLTSPQIWPPDDLDESQEKNVFKVVKYMQNDLKFIEGHFINEFSSQRFGGTSERVSNFIALLDKTGLWKTEIKFRDFGEQDSAFTLSQRSPDSLRLTINSGLEDFLLKDFVEFFLERAASQAESDKR